jgi:hypothetical protein
MQCIFVYLVIFSRHSSAVSATIRDTAGHQRTATCVGTVSRRRAGVGTSVLEAGARRDGDREVDTTPAAADRRHAHATSAAKEYQHAVGDLQCASLTANAKLYLRASITKSTHLVYKSCWNMYKRYCAKHKIDVYNNDLHTFLNYLAHLAETRCSATVKVHKSALLANFDDDIADFYASHRKLRRLLTGIDNLKPVKNKLRIWSFDAALDKLKTYVFREDNLYQFTCHLTTVLALLSGRRLHDLSLLSIADGHIQFTDEGVKLLPVFGGKTDHFSSSSTPWCFISQSNWKVSVPDLIRRFIELSKDHRGDCQSLLIDTYRRNTPAHVRKIRSYVMTVFAKIDIYSSPGSTRSAAATAALLKNVSLKDVMERGGWKSQNTVLKYYYRPCLPSFISCACLLLPRMNFLPQKRGGGACKISCVLEFCLKIDT